MLLWWAEFILGNFAWQNGRITSYFPESCVACLGWASEILSRVREMLCGYDLQDVNWRSAVMETFS